MMGRYDIALGKLPEKEPTPPEFLRSLSANRKPGSPREERAWRRILYRDNHVVREYIDSLVRTTLNDIEVRSRFSTVSMTPACTEFFLFGDAFIRLNETGNLVMDESGLQIHDPDSIWLMLPGVVCPGVKDQVQYWVGNVYRKVRMNLLHLQRGGRRMNPYSPYSIDLYGISVVGLDEEDQPVLSREANSTDFIREWNKHRILTGATE